MFENTVLHYKLIDGVCVITYKKGVHIDFDAGVSIVAEKNRLTKKHPVRKFIGVIHSSVKIDKSIMWRFTTKDAIQDIDAIGVVFLSDKFLVDKYQKISVKILNSLTKRLLKVPKLKFFTNEQTALDWIKKVTL